MLIYIEAAASLTRENLEMSLARSNGILDRLHSAVASDRDDLKKALMKARPSSPAPDVNEFQCWRNALYRAGNEEEIKMIMSELLIDWRYRQVRITERRPAILPDGR